MTLSPQKADFEKVWATLSVGVGKVLTLTNVIGMPMIEYVNLMFLLVLCIFLWYTTWCGALNNPAANTIFLRSECLYCVFEVY